MTDLTREQIDAMEPNIEVRQALGTTTEGVVELCAMARASLDLAERYHWLLARWEEMYDALAITGDARHPVDATESARAMREEYNESVSPADFDAQVQHAAQMGERAREAEKRAETERRIGSSHVEEWMRAHKSMSRRARRWEAFARRIWAMLKHSREERARLALCEPIAKRACLDGAAHLQMVNLLREERDQVQRNMETMREERDTARRELGEVRALVEEHRKRRAASLIGKWSTYGDGACDALDELSAEIDDALGKEQP